MVEYCIVILVALLCAGLLYAFIWGLSARRHHPNLRRDLIFFLATQSGKWTATKIHRMRPEKFPLRAITLLLANMELQGLVVGRLDEVVTDPVKARADIRRHYRLTKAGHRQYYLDNGLVATRKSAPPVSDSD